MTEEESKAKWDRHYFNERDGGSAYEFLTEAKYLIEEKFGSGYFSAADFAGGSGDTALWLSQQGFDTSLIELSTEAIEIAQTKARESNLSLKTIYHDLESSKPLGSSWDLVVCSNFFDRRLFRMFDRYVKPGGLLFVRVATTTNLERNVRPGKRFLAEPDELLVLCKDFQIISHEEEWFQDRHEARLVGCLPEPLTNRN
ncbi:MAG: class I SAM-dependent methyltransferase [Actinomycetota bacterium]|nr:class I SAM-dependent methyltransferase [Acidimicrobiales bacterium]